ncbi:hypothetical protein LIA77_09746 [Sarocladium implicatum]|nr:hypothetical protein LIA77_09746 [Sarocladium implicatum]
MLGSNMAWRIPQLTVDSHTTRTPGNRHARARSGLPDVITSPTHRYEATARVALCGTGPAGEPRQRVKRRHETPDSRTCVETPRVSTGWASMKSMISQYDQKMVCWCAACSIDGHTVGGRYKEGKSFVRVENLGLVGGSCYSQL